MRFDLSDLDRLSGFADALERLFWCLMLVAFFTAILGSHGTGLFVLLLGAVAFVVRVGLEDFVRSRQEEPAAPKRTAKPKEMVIKKTKVEPKRKPAPAPDFNVYRTSRRPRRKKTTV
jgi:hypothetical protein